MENEENVVRLAKPVKKGLLRLVFSRFGLIALLILIQIAIMVAAYGFLQGTAADPDRFADHFHDRHDHLSL